MSPGTAALHSVCMPGSPSPYENHLLAALPVAEFERLTSDLEPSALSLGDVLYESGCEQHHVYFPIDAIISLLYVLEDGASTEIALVGKEGILGVAQFLGGHTMPYRAVVQGAGWAYRLRSPLLQQEFGRGGALAQVLLRYTQALITQIALTAVCNRHHSIDQQLCRWLLMSQDRIGSDSLAMTQDLIANMLGVRREGVTEAAGRLQRAGYIRYARGHITVIDRQALQRHVCECYGVARREQERLLMTHPVRGGAPRGV